ncbi:MAG: amidohydrolase [Caldisericia bacterium]|nr:amidohydrolase [Caldisericia bacterium]
MLLTDCTYINHEMQWVKGHIQISNGIIASISEEIPCNLGQEETYSAKGKYIIPGLMNMHTHMAMTLFRGYADDLPLREWLETRIFPIEAKLTPEAVYYGSLLGIAESIRSGCTFFNDMYFFTEETIKAVERSGIRALLSPGMMDTAGAEKIQTVLSMHREFHGAANGRISIFFGPHAPYTCNLSFLTSIAETAQKHGVGIHIHLNETEKEVIDFKKIHKGISPIVKIAETGLFDNPTIAAHCVHVSEEEQEILREKEILVINVPSSNLKLSSGIAPIQTYLNKGIQVGIGTDGASSNNQINMISEMRLSSLLGKVFPIKNPKALDANTVFKMGTTIPGQWLFPNQCGLIQEGAFADLVFLTMKFPSSTPCYHPISNIVYASNGSEVDSVIVQGKFLMKEKVITSFDEEFVIQKVNEIAYSLTGQRSNSV